MSRYFIVFTASVVLFAGALIGFNIQIDPYAIYRNQEALLKNEQPVLVMNERVFKTVRLARIPANVLLLGSSRTDIGIGRGQEAFTGQRALNLSTFGQPIRETRRLLELALRHGKPKTVVIGLDLFAFNALFKPPPDFVQDNYNPLRRYYLMLSISTLSDSWKARRIKVPGPRECCYGTGFRTPQNPASLVGTYRANFAEEERMYLMKSYLPYPSCRFSLSKHGNGSTLDDFRAIVRLAHEKHVDLRLFISPSHAYQWETLRIAGLWTNWEEWKRQLLRIDDEEASTAKAAPFPLWDFSGYDEVSTEEVPAPDSKVLMHNYSDQSHYTPSVGRRIIQRIFASPSAPTRDTWGVKMTPSNAEPHLEQVRLARDQYATTHPADIAQIKRIADEAMRLKQCPSR